VKKSNSLERAGMQECIGKSLTLNQLNLDLIKPRMHVKNVWPITKIIDRKL
jgi:hypothetical protein